MVNPAPAAPPTNATARPWYRQLNGYHWLVLVVATMAWAFDCLSQQIFNLTRKPAMDALADTPAKADFFGPLSTTALLVGWATGGIIFGILGDRIGRAKTLTIMILCYSVSTGLCGLSTGPWDYILYCFITGVGAGGIFPIACTLVAESLPDRTRPQALGMVQTFSAFGNIGAGVISLGFVALLAGGRDFDPLAMDVQRRHHAIAPGDHCRPQAPRAGSLEAGRSRRKGQEGGAGRTVLRSPLAAERDRRPVAGGLRRGGPLGNRRVQQ